ncbi:Adenylylsulfate kinase [Terfezia claveryi]|nr:Adenylylsulfate kinase [Terfezia claveryi]
MPACERVNLKTCREERNKYRGQQGTTIWLTGLSVSGKPTDATVPEQQLLHNGIAAYRLDGDNIRFSLNKDSSFSGKDRNENIRRIAEVSKLFADASTVSIISFISPYRADQLTTRELHCAASPQFIEVHIDIPLEVAETRDPKGLYKKAREGIIKDFTGISAPYEAPENSELKIRTNKVSVEEAFQEKEGYLH